jgi:integrase
VNEQNMNNLNTLQDVMLVLPQLYSESSCKAYTAAFKRIERLTGQRLTYLPADEVAWSDLSAQIVWAGQFQGLTQRAAERAFETWRGKIGAAIKRARTQAGPSSMSRPDATAAWDLLLGYVKAVESKFDATGQRILPNMSSLSVMNLRARLKDYAPANLTTQIAETTLIALPADKAATFRRSIRFFDKLIKERARHVPITALLPEVTVGPLRTLRDKPINWAKCPDSFRASLDQMITVAIRGHTPRHDPLAGMLGADPLAARRGARKNRRKPVRNPRVAEKGYKAALSWLARHAYADRDDVYDLADVRQLLTPDAIDRAAARYVARTKDDPALMAVQETSSLSSYLATLATLARTNQIDEAVLHAIEDARFDTETWSPYSNEMSAVREAFIKKLDRDPQIVRVILSGARKLMDDAQRDQARWEHLSYAAQAQTLHLMMAAAMIALQLARPLRTKNINELTIGGPNPELIAPRGKMGEAWLDIRRGNVKNRQTIESPLPRAAWRVLSLWIEIGRPRWIALHAGQQVVTDCYLFPGIGPSGAVCRQTLNTAWNRGADRLGLTGMTPHMMRHVAATVFLARHPGQYGVVADLLGDRPETVEAFYARGAGHAAARLFAEVLNDLDPSLKLGRRSR